MDNAGYITLSRQAALFRQMDVIANNIANANTLGYKHENMMFEQYLVGKSGVNESAFTSDFSTMRDMGQGPLQITHRPLDAAIDGKGFFEVETPLGTRYTRVGSFQVNADGELVTAQGYRVNSTSGPIAFSDDDIDITIREDGTIFAKRPTGEEEERGTLKVMMFDRPQFLKKLPNGTYDAGEERPQIAEVTVDYRISQGALESSNVNTTRELTEMIKVSRSVGLTTNFLKDMDELSRKAVNTIARQQ